MKNLRLRGPLAVTLAFLLVVVLAAAAPIGGSVSVDSGFNITSISDIPAYGIVEPSGCGGFKGRVKIRIDMFMTSDAPHYDKHHVQVVDETSKEYMAGYPGETDPETGEPLDWDDYSKWLDGLPHVWQDNPFHSHMVYFDTKVTDEKIKAKVVEVTEYFYAFHLHCWDGSKVFVEEWKKVPTERDTVREPIIDSVEAKSECEIKATEIVGKVDDYDTRNLESGGESPRDLNIGKEGTVDVGSPAINRGGSAPVRGYGWYFTIVEGANPANADGTIDTVEAWFYTADSGNSVKYGTFEHLGSNELKCHDAELYGQVSAGSKQTCTGLSIGILTGEYIGADARTTPDLFLEMDTSGGTGYWTTDGQFCDPNDQETFGWDADNIISLYGTGEEAVVDVVIEASTFSELYHAAVRGGIFWTSPTVGYVIYIDSVLTDLKYRKTTDGGATWGSSVSIKTGWIFGYDCWADWQTAGDTGTKIHIAYIDNDPDDVRYVYLDTNGDSVGGDDQIESYQGTGAMHTTIGWAYRFISITKTRGGNLAVAFRYKDNASTIFDEFYTSPDGDAWTKEIAPWLTPADADYILLFPGNEADNQDVWAAYWDISGDTIFLKVYDDSANDWSGETISTSMIESTVYSQMDGQVRLSDGHLIFAAWNEYDVVTADLKVWDINGTGSITAKTDVITNADDTFLASVFINQVNDDIYTAYAEGTAAESLVKVYYKKSVNGGANWGSRTTLQANTEDDERWISAGTMKATWGGKFQPFWFNDDLNDLFTNPDYGISIAAEAAVGYSFGIVIG